jgi:hypothetical protein
MSGDVADLAEAAFRLPEWAEWLKALTIPIAGVIGVLIGTFNAWTSHEKRKQDLFQARYSLYMQIMENVEIKNGIFRDAIYYRMKERGVEWSDDDFQKWHSADDKLRYRLIPEAGFVFGKNESSKLKSECIAPDMSVAEVDEERVQKILGKLMRLR